MLRRTERRLVAVMALTGGILLTGCSGAGGTPVATPTHLDLTETWGDDVGNGVSLLGTEDARAAVLSAIRSADSLRMTGAFIDTDGRTLTLAVNAGDEGTVAEFTNSEGTTEVTLLDSVIYVLPSDALASATDLPPGVYSCVAPDHPATVTWSTLLDPLRTVAAFTSDASAIGQAGDGIANLILGAEGALGTLTVSSEGAPLPIRLVRADAGGTVDLSFEAEEPVVPEVPSPLAEGC